MRAARTSIWLRTTTLGIGLLGASLGGWSSGGSRAGVAWAAPPNPAAPITTNDEGPRDSRHPNHERLRAEVLDQMRAMRMWKLTEELQLDQSTAAKVFPILAQFDEQARAIGRERKDIGREVAEAAYTGRPDETKIRQLIDRLLANQQRRNALDEQRFLALKPALTPLQQAKLLLLLPRLEDDFRRRIRDAMMGQDGRGDGRNDGRGDGRNDDGMRPPGPPPGMGGGRPFRRPPPPPPPSGGLEAVPPR